MQACSPFGFFFFFLISSFGRDFRVAVLSMILDHIHEAPALTELSYQHGSDRSPSHLSAPMAHLSPGSCCLLGSQTPTASHTDTTRRGAHCRLRLSAPAASPIAQVHPWDWFRRALTIVALILGFSVYSYLCSGFLSAGAVLHAGRLR